MSYSFIPDDPIGTIFTASIIKRLQRRLACISNSPDEYNRLLTRLNILTAGGEVPPSSPQWCAYSIKYWRAQKSAWNIYFLAAYASGLFDGTSGVDLRRRLTGIDNDNFQGAIAECMACWFFLGKLQLEVQGRPKGNGNHSLEFLIAHPQGNLHIEVKAPYRPSPHQSWAGNDSDKIEACLDEANRQFQPGNRNVLVIAPSLRLPLYSERGSLIEAFYGQEAVVMDINTTTGETLGEARVEFQHNGKFLKNWGQQGPRFTRTGMVLSIEEKYDEYRDIIDHNILILHNPLAKVTCPNLPLTGVPEFKLNGNSMAWSDGHSLS